MMAEVPFFIMGDPMRFITFLMSACYLDIDLCDLHSKGIISPGKH